MCDVKISELIACDCGIFLEYSVSKYPIVEFLQLKSNVSSYLNTTPFHVENKSVI